MSFANSTKVALDLRGVRLSLEREALMELPESVLLCLFPNGVVLSPQRPLRADATEDDEEEEDVYFVDVSVASLASDPPGHDASDHHIRWTGTSERWTQSKIERSPPAMLHLPPLHVKCDSG